MSYVKDILNNFKKQYGDKWLERYFSWQNSHKGQVSKALTTAKNRGDVLVKSLAKTAKGKARARAEVKLKKRKHGRN